MWQVIARSLFGVALLAGVVAYVEPSRLIASTESLRLEWLATAVLLGFGGILIQWWKWAQLSRLLPRRFTPSQVSRTLFGGFVLGMMSPGRVGEFGRAVFVDDQHRSVSALTNTLTQSASGMVPYRPALSLARIRARSQAAEPVARRLRLVQH